MPIRYDGPAKGVREVSRAVRGLPLLERTIEQLDAIVSVVPGSFTTAPPAAPRFSRANVATRSSAASTNPLLFARLDVSPSVCASHDRGEAGMGIKSRLAAATAGLVDSLIPEDLRQAVAGIAAGDGRRLLAKVREMAAADADAARDMAQAGIRITGRSLRTLDINRLARSEALARAARAASPESPALGIWPDYWAAAVDMAFAAERLAEHPDGEEPSAARRTAATVRLAVREFMAAHMPYAGEMLSDDQRWALPRRIFAEAIAEAHRRVGAYRAAFGLFAASATEAAEADPVTRARRALLAAQTDPDDLEMRLAGTALARHVSEFWAASPSAPSTDSHDVQDSAVAVLAVFSARLEGLHPAIAIQRAAAHAARVGSMGKCILPAGQDEADALVRTLADHPRLAALLRATARLARETGPLPGDGPDAALCQSPDAVSDAEAVCRVLSLALQQSRPRRNEGRAAALRAVDDEVAILAAGADRGRARRPVDLWHMLVTQGAPAGLSRPGAWQDMAAGATGAIHGLGRTLDHRAFAMAAHGLTSGLARIRELDAACALTGEAGEALRRAGMAVISVSRALSEGTDVADRYAALTDDLAAIRDAAEALPAEFSAAILDAVAGHLAIGLGRRDRSGYTLPHGERIFLASEAAAAEAGACWFEQAAEGCNEEDAAYWMENAASARAARGAEAPARRF